MMNDTKRNRGVNMSQSTVLNGQDPSFKKRNYKPWIIGITLLVNGLVAVLSG